MLSISMTVGIVHDLCMIFFLLSFLSELVFGCVHVMMFVLIHVMVVQKENST